MSTKKILVSALLVFGFFLTAVAQDTIIKTNQDTVLCKIQEITSNEIKYLLPDYPEDVLFSIEKSKVSLLIFANGKEMTFIDEMHNPENYELQNKNALKIDFLAPFTGNSTFAYERSLKPGQSLEFTLGIIGLGFDESNNNSIGSFAKFGWKFIRSPDFYLKGMRYAHILKGGYVKPEIGFGYFAKDVQVYNTNTYQYSTKRENNFSVVLHIVIGKQWVINDFFLLDFYGGVGYGFENQNEEYHYGYIINSTDIPLSFSAGFKIGLLF
jgi:hypothetical protein